MGGTSPHPTLPSLPSHGRYGYSAITRRPVYDWPGDRRLAVYIGLNLEHCAFGEGLGPWISQSRVTPDLLAEAG